MTIVTPSQVLYGTDFPFRDGAEENGGLSAFRFEAKDLRAIERDNALKAAADAQSVISATVRTRRL